MAAVELLCSLLLGSALTAAARWGRGPPPDWTRWFGAFGAAWLAGFQGLLFLRFPDYMVAYLIEARGQALLCYLLWAAAFVAGAQLGAELSQPGRLRLRGWALGVFPRLLPGLMLAAGSLALLPRLHFSGSTLEFGLGLQRPLAATPAVQTLLGLTAIAAGIPLLGTVGLLLLESWRLGARASIR